MKTVQVLPILAGTIFIFISVLPESNGTGPSEWTVSTRNELTSLLSLQSYKEKSYYFGIIGKLNYYESQAFCRYNGMELLSVTSKEETEAISKLLKTFGLRKTYKFFTSAMKIPPDNDWVWMSTGKPIESYRNWYEDQPSNSGGKENCMEIVYNGSSLQWNDLPCDLERKFICELVIPKSTAYLVNAPTDQ